MQVGREDEKGDSDRRSLCGERVGAQLSSNSECIDCTLMHGALSKWETQNLDPRRIPDVEGMLALVKLGRRSIDRGIKWAKMMEYCRETRKQAEVVPVTAFFLAPHGCASPQGDKIEQSSTNRGPRHQQGNHVTTAINCLPNPTSSTKFLFFTHPSSSLTASQEHHSVLTLQSEGNWKKSGKGVHRM